MRWRRTIRAGARVTGRENEASGSASRASSGWKAPSTRALERRVEQPRAAAHAARGAAAGRRLVLDVEHGPRAGRGDLGVDRERLGARAGRERLEARDRLEPERERLLDLAADVGVLRGGRRREGERERGGEPAACAAAAHSARPRGTTTHREAHDRPRSGRRRAGGRRACAAVRALMRTREAAVGADPHRAAAQHERRRASAGQHDAGAARGGHAAAAAQAGQPPGERVAAARRGAQGGRRARAGRARPP